MGSACSVFLDPEYENSERVSAAELSASFEAVRSLVHDAKAGRVPQKIEERGCIALNDPLSIVTALYYRLTDPQGDRSA